MAAIRLKKNSDDLINTFVGRFEKNKHMQQARNGN